MEVVRSAGILDMLGRWDQQDLLKDRIGGCETEKGVKTDFRLLDPSP